MIYLITTLIINLTFSQLIWDNLRLGEVKTASWKPFIRRTDANNSRKTGIYDDQWTNWFDVDTTANPGKRYGSCYWSINNRFILFGGKGFDGSDATLQGLLNDVWEFHPDYDLFRTLSGDQVHDPSASFSGTEKPSGKLYSNCFEKNGDLIITGGFGHGTSGDSEKRSSDHVWNYNLNSRSWSHQSGTIGDLGAFARQESGGFRNKDLIHIFGGVKFDDISTCTFLNDLIEYDTVQNSYSTIQNVRDGKLEKRGEFHELNVPSKRAGFASWYITGSFFLYGGYISGSQNCLEDHNVKYYNDLWMMREIDFQWNLKGGSITPNQPPYYGVLITDMIFSKHWPGSRAKMGVFSVNDEFYIFGGKGLGYLTLNSVQLLSDMWKFDIETFSLVFVGGNIFGNVVRKYGAPYLPEPGGRANPVCWSNNTKNEINENLIIFGGITLEVKKRDGIHYNVVENDAFSFVEYYNTLIEDFYRYSLYWLPVIIFVILLCCCCSCCCILCCSNDNVQTQIRVVYRNTARWTRRLTRRMGFDKLKKKLNEEEGKELNENKK